VIDDHLVHPACRLEVSIVAGKLGNQFVALLCHGTQAPANREDRPCRLQLAHCRRQRHPHHLWRDRPVARRDLDPTACRHDGFRCLKPGGVARAVLDQDICAWFDIAGEDVPTRDDETVAGCQHLVVRQPSRRDDDIVGAFSEHDLGIREAVEVEGDTRPNAFIEPPGDDRQHLATALGSGSQPDLAAGVACGLMDDHVMPPQSGDARGFHPRRPGTHDHHSARLAGVVDPVEAKRLPSSRWVVDA